VRDGPQLDMRMSVAPRLTGGVMSADDSKELDSAPRPRAPGSTELDAMAIPAPLAPSAPPKRKSAVGPIAIALVLLALIGIAAAGGVLAWTMMAAPAPQVATSEPPVAPPIATTPEPPAVTPAPSATTGSVFIDS